MRINNLDDLQDIIRRLQSILDDREVGLHTWRFIYSSLMESISDYWTWQQTQGVGSFVRDDIEHGVIVLVADTIGGTSLVVEHERNEKMQKVLNELAFCKRVLNEIGSGDLTCSAADLAEEARIAIAELEHNS
jgi:hypothetical protein